MTRDHSTPKTRRRSIQPERQAAVELAGKGLATVAEVARLAGVSRQLALHWCKGIDVAGRRHDHLQKLWDQRQAKLTKA